MLALYAAIQDSEHDLHHDEANGELLESEILEEGRGLFTQQVLEEIEYRIAVLGSDYPFELDSYGSQWRILPTPRCAAGKQVAAHCCYLFCLLASALRDNCVHGARGAHLKGRMERLFQDVAVDAAAAIMNGNAVSFGWPRPEGTGFRPALADACQQLGLGEPLQDSPAWSRGQEKDAGIDVIAWREFRDRRPGKLVLLGQVASGRNWPSKSVKNDTDRFFAWFSKSPTEHFIPSIFIPFPQYHECRPHDETPFADVAEAEAWLRERSFGLVVDRLRIVEVVAARLDSAEGKVGRLCHWVRGALDLARAAA